MTCKYIIIASSFLVFMGTTGCTTLRRSPPSQVSQKPEKALLIGAGVISYYADSFSGNRTANGEYYNPAAFTAAHPSLPFGTLVLVKSQRTGRSVIVRINDRGPWAKGRMLDLSRAAAQSLGMIGHGVVKARIYKISESSHLVTQL